LERRYKAVFTSIVVGDFRVFLCPCIKTSLMFHFYKNAFQLDLHFRANQTDIHKKGFARGLLLKQRRKATRKWPICACFWFCITTLGYGRKLAPFCHLIGSKTRTNRFPPTHLFSLALRWLRVFALNFLLFARFSLNSDWSEWLVWFLFHNIQLKSVLLTKTILTLGYFLWVLGLPFRHIVFNDVTNSPSVTQRKSSL